MKRAALLLILSLAVLVPLPAEAADGTAREGPWRPYYEVAGGPVYAFSEDVVRDGDRVRVRVRSVDVPESRGWTTTILYEMDCRRRVFRMLEVVEEKGAERNICRTVSDDFPIRPAKHPHLEMLRSLVCP